MKVLFLDVDGVLNYRGFLQHGQRPATEDQICPVRAARIQEVCDRTGAVLVLSSTWRLSRTRRSMQAILKRRGVTAPIVDTTMWFPLGPRGEEIGAWLDTHDVDGFCIVDDDVGATHMLGTTKPSRRLASHYVRTYYDFRDAPGDGGIQAKDVEKAVRILNG